MPKFVIERQYLVPMYQHIVVEAETLEEACKKGISDDIDWDTQEMDSDNARQTTITNAKMITRAVIAGELMVSGVAMLDRNFSRNCKEKPISAAAAMVPPSRPMPPRITTMNDSTM